MEKIFKNYNEKFDDEFENEEYYYDKNIVSAFTNSEVNSEFNNFIIKKIKDMMGNFDKESPSQVRLLLYRIEQFSDVFKITKEKVSKKNNNKEVLFNEEVNDLWFRHFFNYIEKDDCFLSTNAFEFLTFCMTLIQKNKNYFYITNRELYYIQLYDETFLEFFENCPYYSSAQEFNSSMYFFFTFYENEKIISRDELRNFLSDLKIKLSSIIDHIHILYGQGKEDDIENF